MLLRYYKVLGINDEATSEEIKLAYYTLVKIWHPDRFPRDERVRRIAEERLIQINEAYTALTSLGTGFRRCRPQNTQWNTEEQTDFAPPPEPRSEHSRKAKSNQQRKFVPMAWTLAASLVVVILTVAILFPGIGTTANSVLAGSAVDETESLPAPYSSSSNIRLGSSKGEVLALQGDPSDFNNNVWRYGHSLIQFENGNVVNWYNSPTHPLQVRTNSPNMEMGQQFCIAVGATKEEVIAIQGAPTEFTDEYWAYGSSLIRFENNRVANFYNNASTPLKAIPFLDCSDDNTNKQLTIGLSKEDVLLIQGVPTQIAEEFWSYGLSKIFFLNDKVINWHNNPVTPLLTVSLEKQDIASTH